jgi:hypothetical protein
MRKRIWDSIKGVWKEVTAEHPIHAAKRAVKDAKKAKDKADREAYKKKTKGPRNVLLKFPDTKGESSRTVSISNKQDKSKFYKKRSDPLAMKKSNEKTAADKDASIKKAEAKGKKLKANREKARSKKGSSMFASPKTRRQEEGLKKGMEKRTAHKKRKLEKSRYYIKHRDDKAVVYEWSDKAGKFVVKKGRPSKKDSTYKGERPPRTESGKLAKTDPKKKRFSKEQQIEKTRRTLSKEDFDMLPLKEKGQGLKRPSNSKKLSPSKKKPSKKTQPKHTGSGENLKFTKPKKNKKKDKPYNAGKKAGR